MDSRIKSAGEVLREGLLVILPPSQENSMPSTPAENKIIAPSGTGWEAQVKAEQERCNFARAMEQREQDAYSMGGFRALDQFTPEKFRLTPGNSAAFAAVNVFDCDRDNLYLAGPTGTGKTHLAAIASRKYLRSGNKSYNMVMTKTQMEISRGLRACDGAEAEEDLIFRYIDVDVLVIDDIGIAKDTEFMIATLYEIINGRYMAGHGGLIVTSNLGLGDLAKKLGDDRISSRLAQMCKIFSLAGEPDRRIS